MYKLAISYLILIAPSCSSRRMQGDLATSQNHNRLKEVEDGLLGLGIN
jgi:hypothetical protein